VFIFLSWIIDCTFIVYYYIRNSNKGIFVWPIWPELNCPCVHTPDNNRLLDYYKIISISRPILARANMGLDFVSGQYGCLFSRCRKYVINSLIHGHFHIGLVIIPRPPYWRERLRLGHFHIGLVTIPRPPYWPERLRLGPIWGSRDDNQANMEMPMY
jgi:hypothetical protein